MNILNLLSRNFEQGSRTRKPDDAVPYPAGFRGKLVHAVDLCTACGTCAYSCSPGAITIDNAESFVSRWNYMEDRCTFCGFCIQYCPTHALSFEDESPSLLTERVQHYLSHEIILQPCKVCGQPVRALPDVILHQIYGDPLPKEILETLGLCERCRQTLISKRFFNTMVAKGDRHDE